ncbi:hypothetical protein BJ508DRAFT_29157 [Ascobolus immersus RN42]|uniref:Uncharacterized protein n=1 Tax=Ascobolus immersus RN42 TaxID=1160509 RepID=A0A3N4HLV8_ASCIM|nr:hypothetical protein BJ508DRAFT_29157 [Ascobolus immersus RN42]
MRQDTCKFFPHRSSNLRLCISLRGKTSNASDSYLRWKQTTFVPTCFSSATDPCIFSSSILVPFSQQLPASRLFKPGYDHFAAILEYCKKRAVIQSKQPRPTPSPYFTNTHEHRGFLQSIRLKSMSERKSTQAAQSHRAATMTTMAAMESHSSTSKS